jgi:hypothetical protein
VLVFQFLMVARAVEEELNLQVVLAATVMVVPGRQDHIY